MTARPTAQHRPRRSRWLLAGLLVAALGLVLALATGLGLSHGLGTLAQPPFAVWVDGQDVTGSLSLARPDSGPRWLLAAALLLLALWLVILLPLALLAGLVFVLLAVGAVVLGALGLPLLVVAGVAGLLLLPLLVLVALVRWLLR